MIGHNWSEFLGGLEKSQEMERVGEDRHAHRFGSPFV